MANTEIERNSAVKLFRFVFAAGGFGDLPDRHADVVAVLACVRLHSLAPAAVKQEADGLHAGAVRRAVAGDPGQRLDAQFRVGARQ